MRLILHLSIEAWSASSSNGNQDLKLCKFCFHCSEFLYVMQRFSPVFLEAVCSATLKTWKCQVILKQSENVREKPGNFVKQESQGKVR